MSNHRTYTMSAKAVDEVAARKLAAKPKRPAGTAQDAATHYELAQRWILGQTECEHSPVYSGGVFFVPDAAGLWQPRQIEEVENDIAAANVGQKLCRKASDYRGIASVAASLCSNPRFFDAAHVGVVTPAGFHSIDATGRVFTSPLALDHRQVFRLTWAPDDACPTPLVDQMIATALDGPDRAEQTDLLWQLIGAVLFGLLPRLQCVGLLVGREGSGKSTLQRLIERLFPAEAVSAVSPSSWGREYNVAALAGKRLNVVGELSEDQPIPPASFKNVTGQNTIEGRHPTHRPFYFVCTAAHLFASNVLPPTTDRTDAFFRRWRVVVFRGRVPDGKADPDLLDKILAAEVPGILARAFQAAEDVAVAGRLMTTAAHDQQIAKWKAAANPVLQFLLDDEVVELDREAPPCTTKRVFERYRRWSAAVGFRNPFGRNHFLELLDATGQQVGVSVKRNMVTGLRLAVDPASDRHAAFVDF